MKKKLFVVILLGLFLLGVTGCGNKIKEEDLIGLKYDDLSEKGKDYFTHWEFKEANVLYSYSTNCGAGSVGVCNAGTYIYEIDSDAVLVLTMGEWVYKYKISEDLSTITEIGTEKVMTRVN